MEKKVSKYEEITRAREILGIPENATMKDIKLRHRNLVKKWHPDVCSRKREICEEMTAKVNEAYRVIIGYCENYQYSFSRKEVEKYLTGHEWWVRKFGADPLWGKN